MGGGVKRPPYYLILNNSGTAVATRLKLSMLFPTSISHILTKFQNDIWLHSQFIVILAMRVRSEKCLKKDPM